MADETEARRGPGRPRREQQPDVIRQPVEHDERSPEKQQYDEAEARRRENIDIANVNIQKELEDRAKAEEAQRQAEAQSAAERKKAKKAFTGSTTEILLTRKYVPTYVEDDAGDLVEQDNQSGGARALDAGTTISVPTPEAFRAVQLGIATVTQNSFG